MQGAATVTGFFTDLQAAWDQLLNFRLLKWARVAWIATSPSWLNLTRNIIPSTIDFDIYILGLRKKAAVCEERIPKTPAAAT